MKTNLLLLVLAISLTACDIRYNDDIPATNANVSATGDGPFDIKKCPIFKSGYFDAETNEKVYFNLQMNSLVIRDADTEFQVDGVEHSLADGSTYVSSCLKGYVRIMVKSKDKKAHDIFTELFYAPNGGRIDRGIRLNGKPKKQGILRPLSDI